LIRKNTHVAAMEFSRCARAGARRRTARTRRSLKTQQRTSTVEVDIVLGELGSRTAEAMQRAERLPE
jgi:hypothetical protein